jgi:hypothetical protein
MLNLTSHIVNGHSDLDAPHGGTYLQSTSFPVVTSVMINRTQGGGVIGRRSYQVVSRVASDVRRLRPPRSEVD